MNKEHIKALKLLDNYFKETPKDIIKKEIDLISDLNAQSFALTLTDDVMGDSEQLPSFLYKSDGGLYFKHIEDTDITEQWNEYLKTR